MKINFFLICCVFNSLYFFCQTDKEINILDLRKESLVQHTTGQLIYQLVVSNGKEEVGFDNFIFYLENRIGLEEYVNITEIGEDVNPEKMSLTQINEFKTMDPCYLHEFFSLTEKKMYVIRKVPRIGDKPEHFRRYKISYFGTIKNTKYY